MISLIRFVCRFLSPAFGGGPSMPAPQAVPNNPVDDSAARKARDDAASAAQAEALAGGRRSTMVSGIKDEDQKLGSGAAPSRKRASQYLSDGF